MSIWRMSFWQKSMNLFLMAWVGRIIFLFPVKWVQLGVKLTKLSHWGLVPANFLLWKCESSGKVYYSKFILWARSNRKTRSSSKSHQIPSITQNKVRASRITSKANQCTLSPFYSAHMHLCTHALHKMARERGDLISSGMILFSVVGGNLLSKKIYSLHFITFQNICPSISKHYLSKIAICFKTFQ